MPRALAIETSGRVGSVAAVRDGRVLAQQTFEHGLKHAAELVPTMDRLCRDQSWSPRDIEHLYVSTGPGSFTGLRIGITVAKTMSLATGARIVAVPSVRVLADNAPPEARDLIIVLDAKRDQIFTARFTRTAPAVPAAAPPADDDWTESEPAHLDTLTAMLARAPRPVWLLGEGLPQHIKFLPPDDPAINVTDPSLWRPSAAAVATLGHRRARAGQFADPLTLTPTYIRLPEAEEKWRAQQG